MPASSTPAPLNPVRRAAAALVVVCATALLAACSTGSPKLPKDAGDAGEVQPSSAAASSPAAIDISQLDACAILPQADAETLIGTKLTDPLTASNSDVASCTYPGDPSGPTAQVEIYIGDGAKQQLDIDKDKLQHAFTQPTGLGDEAWLEDDMIWARTGDTWASIRLVSLDDAARFNQPLQDAMAGVLSRLG